MKQLRASPQPHSPSRLRFPTRQRWNKERKQRGGGGSVWEIPAGCAGDREVWSVPTAAHAGQDAPSERDPAPRGSASRTRMLCVYGFEHRWGLLNSGGVTSGGNEHRDT